MKVDAELVQYVAQLGRLSLNETEVAYYQKQLDSILDYFVQLDSMPDDLGPDFRHDIIRAETPERLDNLHESLPVDLVFESAPVHSGSSFQVPRILE